VLNMTCKSDSQKLVSIMMKPLFDYLDFVTLIVGLYLN